MADNLNFWLGRIYASDVLGKGRLDATIEIVRKLFAPGSELEKSARSRLIELQNIPDGKCFISGKYLAYLRKLLT